ncbi:MAG: fibronectin type III domain-containing protein [Cyanobacteria bacterium MAG CAR4_bin_6]|nr:fibronectin type III domain-containing protein [Cyanobacteria bacterium MAG CAR4_bin_6]MCY4235013.1 fibronectin type III domain-containing protein [Cyanobacteria bacterium MAG CAR2_bin_4]MCY4331682.1 fibronectin type III domain-containing protein [Cyanobacteria bacterium MAG CAR1_bin_15]
MAGSTNSAQSDEASATPQAGLPNKPTGLSATGGDGEVVLNWTDPSNNQITEWQVQRRMGSGAWGNWTEISGSSATTVSHMVTGLVNIRAVVGSTNGAQSDEVTATPQATVPDKVHRA